MADIKEKTVPPQYTGAKKDIEHTVKATDIDSGRQLFLVARNRLMDVNHWHECAENFSAKFTLTDSQGINLHRTADVHDYIKIAIPAPVSNAGDGYDWVFIEHIEEINDPSKDYDSISIRVRPTNNPETKGENVAHFFTEQSTSSFTVERKNNLLSAAVYGRNEVPNTKTENITDKIRNTVVGIGAIAGLSNVQWNGLVKGLLSDKK
jgi:hypothetical protein